VGERIIVGLGNPGTRYEHTRHNVGFMVIERLAERWHVKLAAERNGLRVGFGVVRTVPVRLVEPLRFMNLTGPVLMCLDPPWTVEDLIVVYDDIDLPIGQLRVRHDGGTGGHRGLSSVVDTFNPNFDRVRIGIGRPPAGVDPADYVLEPIPLKELAELDGVLERASDAVECLAADGLQTAMNRFNVRRPTVEEPSAASALRRTACDDTKH
jgi:PTH1 family peptidyl-tRNA hydrolase